MPIDTVIDENQNLIIRTVEGDLTTDELLNNLAEVIKRPEFKKDQNTIWDFTKGSLKLFKSNDVNRVVSRLHSQNYDRGDNYKVAVVVSNDFDRGIANMHLIELYPLDIKYETFERYDDAYKWITKV